MMIGDDYGIPGEESEREAGQRDGHQRRPARSQEIGAAKESRAQWL